jgi:hypothetical protein
MLTLPNLLIFQSCSVFLYEGTYESNKATDGMVIEEMSLSKSGVHSICPDIFLEEIPYINFYEC